MQSITATCEAEVIDVQIHISQDAKTDSTDLVSQILCVDTLTLRLIYFIPTVSILVK